MGVLTSRDGFCVDLRIDGIHCHFRLTVGALADIVCPGLTALCLAATRVAGLIPALSLRPKTQRSPHTRQGRGRQTLKHFHKASSILPKIRGAGVTKLMQAHQRDLGFVCQSVTSRPRLCALRRLPCRLMSRAVSVSVPRRSSRLWRNGK
jgi:hypothetical protein